jgi:hypothetical protein
LERYAIDDIVRAIDARLRVFDAGARPQGP